MHIMPFLKNSLLETLFWYAILDKLKKECQNIVMKIPLLEGWVFFFFFWFRRKEFIVLKERNTRGHFDRLDFPLITWVSMWAIPLAELLDWGTCFLLVTFYVFIYPHKKRLKENFTSLAIFKLQLLTIPSFLLMNFILGWPFSLV